MTYQMSLAAPSEDDPQKFSRTNYDTVLDRHVVNIYATTVHFFRKAYIGMKLSHCAMHRFIFCMYMNRQPTTWTKEHA